VTVVAESVGGPVSISPSAASRWYWAASTRVAPSHLFPCLILTLIRFLALWWLLGARTDLGPRSRWAVLGNLSQYLLCTPPTNVRDLIQPLQSFLLLSGFSSSFRLSRDPNLGLRQHDPFCNQPEAKCLAVVRGSPQASRELLHWVAEKT
jgi:hypothetical protein